MSQRIRRLVCFCVSAFAIAAAGGGTVMETVTRDLTGAGASTTLTTHAQDGRMRVESMPGDTLMIFRDDTIYTVNTREKSDVMMDRAAMKRMADQLNPALKQLQEQMARMPPEQRAQMEKMMAGMTGPAKEPTQEVRKTNRSGKAGGHACRYVELYEDGALSDELCVAAPGALEGSQELMAAAGKMSALLQEMLSSFNAPGLKNMIARQAANYEQIGGVPVMSRHFVAGKPVNETTLRSIRSEALSAATFEVPAGYTKKDMMPPR